MFTTFNTRRAELGVALTELARHAEKVGVATLAGRMDRELIAKLEDDRFHLVVVGEFNRGKTTLANALLGAQVLPVGATPTTAAIHLVRHAPEPSAQVTDQDGSTRKVPIADLKTFALGVDGRQQTDTAAEPALRHIEISYPAELLREGIVLVDTPGVNDLCLQRAEITNSYIPQSDAVLFVMDAAQPLTESERLFLQDHLIGQSRDKIIFVINKVDIWSEQELAEGLDYLRSELGQLFEGPVIFPVSAKAALDGDREGSGLAALVKHLTAFLSLERGRIMLENACGEGSRAAVSIAHAIDARRRIAQMSSEEIDRRIQQIETDLQGQERTVEERRAAIREQVETIRTTAGRNLDRFVEDVVRQLPDLVDSAEVPDLRVHLPAFLEATFVEWAEEETSEIADALEALAEKTIALMRDDAHEAATRLSAGTHDQVSAPDLQVDTFGYDLGVAALLTIGMGTMFTNAMLGIAMVGAAPLLAYYLRGQIDVQTRDKAGEQATLAVREAAAALRPRLEEMINTFASRLDAWVVEAGQEVHRELIDVLRGAQKAWAKQKPDAERVAAECDALVAELEQIRARIDAYSPSAQLA